MSREDYVHPVTGAAEPSREWLTVWPFRAVVGLVVLAIMVGVYFVIVHLHITGAGNSQG
ncbi:MAG: hypothetical protein ACYDB7_12645 [Mycobacteriales bacterium]